MTHKFCPECGTKASSVSAKFCVKCGASLDSLSQRTIVSAKRSAISFFESDDEDGTETFEVPDISNLKITVDGFDGARSSEGTFGGANSFSFTPNGFAPTRVQRINK